MTWRIHWKTKGLLGRQGTNPQHYHYRREAEAEAEKLKRLNEGTRYWAVEEKKS